jgi:hypothetical protein
MHVIYLVYGSLSPSAIECRYSVYVPSSTLTTKTKTGCTYSIVVDVPHVDQAKTNV